MRKLAALASVLLGLGLLSPGAATAAPEACVVSASGAVRCGSLAEAGRYSAVLVARLYEGRNYTGRRLSLFRIRTCTTSLIPVEWSLDLSKIYHYGLWHNRVMSFTTHNGCDLRVYDGRDGSQFYGWSRWRDRDADMAFGGRNWQRKVDLVRFS